MNGNLIWINQRLAQDVKVIFGNKGEKMICKQCKISYIPTSNFNTTFCSERCRREYYINYSNKYRKHKIKTKFKNFNDLYFMNEEEFIEWFKNNFALFGFKKILKLDRYFPDAIVEDYYGNKIRVELEYYAPSFLLHGHDINFCDLVICFFKPKTLESFNNLPIISIFNGTMSNAGNRSPQWGSFELSDYFNDMVIFFSEQLNTKLKNVSSILNSNLAQIKLEV